VQPIELNAFLFAAALAVFIWVGFSAGHPLRTPRSYFHDRNLSRNIVSLTATNVTLGTGMVYLLSGADHNGTLMLLVPLMTFVGYELLARFVGVLQDERLHTGKNFLASLDLRIREVTGAQSPFARSVSISLVAVFVVVLAFEMFASARLVAPLVIGEPKLLEEALLSLGIFGVTLLYTILGGIAAVFRVDVVQVPLVLAFLAALLGLTFGSGRADEHLVSSLVSRWQFDVATLLAVALASINAVVTQFYSILNWGAVSHVELHHQQRLLRWVGAATAVVLLVFVIAGLVQGSNAGQGSWAAFAEGYGRLVREKTLWAFLGSGALLLGMMSVLLTTSDAVVITCILFWYDNVSGRDSHSDVESKVELSRIRRIGAVTFSVCFLALLGINVVQPDPFYLLLSLAGGVTVFAPLIAVAGYLCSLGSQARALTPAAIYAFLAVFLTSGIANAALLATGSAAVPYVSVVALLASLLLSIRLVIRGHSLRNGSAEAAALPR
jgi:hypothetical protein